MKIGIICFSVYAIKQYGSMTCHFGEQWLAVVTVSLLVDLKTIQVSDSLFKDSFIGCLSVSETKKFK
jgi:hypothetical protein